MLSFEIILDSTFVFVSLLNQESQGPQDPQAQEVLRVHQDLWDHPDLKGQEVR